MMSMLSKQWQAKHDPRGEWTAHDMMQKDERNPEGKKETHL
jgi:hypothetical protein